MCLRFQFCTHQRVCILHFLKKVKFVDVVPYCTCISCPHLGDFLHIWGIFCTSTILYFVHFVCAGSLVHGVWTRVWRLRAGGLPDLAHIRPPAASARGDAGLHLRDRRHRLHVHHLRLP
jgi:hypothetical protein